MCESLNVNQIHQNTYLVKQEETSKLYFNHTFFTFAMLGFEIPANTKHLYNI